ncbi:MAG: hypothetical protein WCI96_08220 [Planctomycetota bacterium]
MIESTIIGWIGTATTAGSRVSVGARLQSTTLPALVIDLTEGSAAALPSTTRNLYQYSLSMSSVANTMLDAQSLSDAAIALVKTGALVAGGCAYEPVYAVIQPPNVGEGDEVEPAIVTATMTIMYRA